MDEVTLKRILADKDSPRGEQVCFIFNIISEYDGKEHKMDCYRTIVKDENCSEQSINASFNEAMKYIHNHWNVIDEKGFEFYNFRAGVFNNAKYGDKFKCMRIDKPAIYLGCRNDEFEDDERFRKTHLLQKPKRERCWVFSPAYESL